MMTDTITCPSGCAGSLPPVSFSKCTPDFRLSQITHLLLGKGDAAAFTDWTTATEWGTRLDQADTTSDSIRTLTVTNVSISNPQVQEYAGSDNRKKRLKTTYTINATIDEVNDTNYDFFRNILCGGLEFKCWWVSNNKKDLFGGSTGVTVTANGNFDFGSAENDVQKFVMTLEFSEDWPARCVNPIAGL